MRRGPRGPVTCASSEILHVPAGLRRAREVAREKERETDRRRCAWKAASGAGHARGEEWDERRVGRDHVARLARRESRDEDRRRGERGKDGEKQTEPAVVPRGKEDGHEQEARDDGNHEERAGKRRFRDVREVRPGGAEKDGQRLAKEPGQVREESRARRQRHLASAGALAGVLEVPDERGRGAQERPGPARGERGEIRAPAGPCQEPDARHGDDWQRHWGHPDADARGEPEEREQRHRGPARLEPGVGLGRESDHRETEESDRRVGAVGREDLVREEERRHREIAPRRGARRGARRTGRRYAAVPAAKSAHRAT